MTTTDQDKREWIVMGCLDASRDAHGNRRQHKERVPALDAPMINTAALRALHAIERQNHGEDFSIRGIGDVHRFGVSLSPCPVTLQRKNGPYGYFAA